MKFKNLLKGLKYKAQKNAPSLMIFGGIVVGGAALVTACVQSTKLHDIIDDAKSEMEKRDTAVLENKQTKDDNGNVVPYTEEMAKSDKRHVYAMTIVKIAKLYAIPAALSALSIALILKGNKMFKVKVAEGVAAYNGLFAAYNAAKDRAEEVLGTEKANDIFNGIRHSGEFVDGEYVDEETGEVRKVHAEKCEGEGNGRWTFIFNQETSSMWSSNQAANEMLFTAQDADLDKMLKYDGALLMNQVLRKFGIKPTKHSMSDGWIRKDLGGKDGFFFCERTLLDYDTQTWLLEFNGDGDISEMYEDALFRADRRVVKKRQW